MLLIRQPVSPIAITRLGFGFGRTNAFPPKCADRALPGIAVSHTGRKPVGTGRRSVIRFFLPSIIMDGQLPGEATITRAMPAPLSPSSTHAGVSCCAEIPAAPKVNRARQPHTRLAFFTGRIQAGQKSSLRRMNFIRFILAGSRLHLKLGASTRKRNASMLEQRLRIAYLLGENPGLIVSVMLRPGNSTN